MNAFERGTIVVLTYNRRARLLQTLRALSRLPDKWPIIVVDNGSSDGTASAVSHEFPTVLLIRSRRNIGAAARNIAVAYVHTPYVAFCDEDTQWQPGSLQLAAGVLDAHPRIGVVNGCVLVGETARIDPACLKLAGSPLERDDLPGPPLLDFMAGACVVRTRAFYEGGGYWPPLFFGGEEVLLALDLAQKGWWVVYLEEVLARRQVARHLNKSLERRRLRNAIWVAWLRLPIRLAWAETLMILREAAGKGLLRSVLILSMAGITRVAHQRRVVTPRIAGMHARFFAPLAEPASPGAQTARRSLA